MYFILLSVLGWFSNVKNIWTCSKWDWCWGGRRSGCWAFITGHQRHNCWDIVTEDN